MGCDIHMYCEVKQKNSKKWDTVGRIFKNEYAKYHKGLIWVFEDGESFGEPYVIYPYLNRNYNLFAVLAGVRNGTWGDQVKPISKPRGLPEDVSKFVLKKSEEYGVDGHSHSHISLSELEKYNWGFKISIDAYVDKEVAEEFNKTGIKPTEYAALSSHGVAIQWTETIGDLCKQFLLTCMPQLTNLKKFGEVRIVFWFDN